MNKLSKLAKVTELMRRSEDVDASRTMLEPKTLRHHPVACPIGTCGGWGGRVTGCDENPRGGSGSRQGFCSRSAFEPGHD